MAPINPAQAKAAAINFVKAVKDDASFKSDKILDSGEIAKLLVDKFNNAGTDFKLDTNADGKFDFSDLDGMKVLGELFKLSEADVGGDPALKEALKELQAKVKAELNAGKFNATPPPANLKFDGLDFSSGGADRAKLGKNDYSSIDPKLKKAFIDIVKANKGKKIDFSGRDANFAKTAMGGTETADNLAKVFWENADQDEDGNAMRLFRMGEIVSAFKYLNSPGAKFSKADFIQAMADYINNDPTMKNQKEFIAITFLGTIQATDFSDPSMAGIKDFAKELAQGIAGKTLDVAALAKGDVAADFNSTQMFGSNLFGSSALVKDGSGNLRFIEYETGNPLNKIGSGPAGGLGAGVPGGTGAPTGTPPTGTPPTGTPPTTGSTLADLDTEAKALDTENDKFKTELLATGTGKAGTDAASTANAAQIRKSIPQLIADGNLTGLRDLRNAYQAIKVAAQADGLTDLKDRLEAYIKKLDQLIDKVEKSTEFAAKKFEKEVFPEFQAVNVAIEGVGGATTAAYDDTLLDTIKPDDLKIADAAKDPIKLAEVLGKLKKFQANVAAAQGAANFPPAGNAVRDKTDAAKVKLDDLITQLEKIQKEQFKEAPAKAVEGDIKGLTGDPAGTPVIPKDAAYAKMEVKLGGADPDIALINGAIGAGIEATLNNDVNAKALSDSISNLIEKTLTEDAGLTKAEKTELVKKLTALQAKIIDGAAKSLIGDDTVLGNDALRNEAKAQGLIDFDFGAVLTDPAKIDTTVGKLNALQAKVAGSGLAPADQATVNARINMLKAKLESFRDSIRINIDPKLNTATAALEADAEYKKPDPDGLKEKIDAVKALNAGAIKDDPAKRVELFENLNAILKKIDADIAAAPPAPRPAQLAALKANVTAAIAELKKLP